MACSSTGFFLATVPTVTFMPCSSTGHRLATNYHVHEWDVVVPRFLRQHGLESLAWRVLQVEQARPPPVTSGYPGQAQSCSFVNELSLVNWPYTCMCMANLTGDGLQ